MQAGRAGKIAHPTRLFFTGRKMEQMSDYDQANILMVDDQPGKLPSYEAILRGLGKNLLKPGLLARLWTFSSTTTPGYNFGSLSGGGSSVK